jgi:flagellar protein FliS
MVANDLARAYRANSILTASPGQLVLCLYDGALNALARTRQAFALPAGDLQRYELINRNIRQARQIVGELKRTLNFDANKEFAGLMYSLYDYYNRRLFEANMKKTEEPVVEVERLLADIRNAWAEMLRKPASETAPVAGQAA